MTIDNLLSIHAVYRTLRTLRDQLQLLQEQTGSADTSQIKFSLAWVKHIENNMELHECALLLPAGSTNKEVSNVTGG